tara:strand:+ start:391 stop:624 length:234 start_codon:yes stop_codon:yes gene_type:complete
MVMLVLTDFSELSLVLLLTQVAQLLVLTLDPVVFLWEEVTLMVLLLQGLGEVWVMYRYRMVETKGRLYMSEYLKGNK